MESLARKKLVTECWKSIAFDFEMFFFYGRLYCILLNANETHSNLSGVTGTSCVCLTLIRIYESRIICFHWVIFPGTKLYFAFKVYENWMQVKCHHITTCMHSKRSYCLPALRVTQSNEKKGETLNWIPLSSYEWFIV